MRKAICSNKRQKVMIIPTFATPQLKEKNKLCRNRKTVGKTFIRSFGHSVVGEGVEEGVGVGVDNEGE